MGVSNMEKDTSAHRLLISLHALIDNPTYCHTLTSPWFNHSELSAEEETEEKDVEGGGRRMAAA